MALRRAVGADLVDVIVDHRTAVARRVAHFLDVIALAHLERRALQLQRLRGGHRKIHGIEGAGVDADLSEGLRRASAQGEHWARRDSGDASQLVLVLVHEHAIACGDVFVLEIAVGPTGLGRHRNIMSYHPRRRIVADRRQASHTRLGRFLAHPAVNDISVAVIPGVARSEFDVVGPEPVVTTAVFALARPVPYHFSGLISQRFAAFHFVESGPSRHFTAGQRSLPDRTRVLDRPVAVDPIGESERNGSIVNTFDDEVR